MNNSLIAIIGAVIVIGGGAFFLLGNNSATNTANENTAPVSNTEQEESNDDVPESFTGNLTQLFALGRNISCTFSQSDAEAEQTGTVYISGDRMRGDFSMNFKQGGGEMEASVIQKDDTIYSWGSSPFGDFATKVAVQEEDELSNKDSIDLDEELDYSCQRWQVDNSMFALPNNVDFDDINQEVNQINESTQQLLNLQCGACDDIPDANAQAQCRAALGC